jgi:hypothetical protein
VADNKLSLRSEDLSVTMIASWSRLYRKAGGRPWPDKAMG